MSWCLHFSTCRIRTNSSAYLESSYEDWIVHTHKECSVHSKYSWEVEKIKRSNCLFTPVSQQLAQMSGYKTWHYWADEWQTGSSTYNFSHISSLGGRVITNLYYRESSRSQKISITPSRLTIQGVTDQGQPTKEQAFSGIIQIGIFWDHIGLRVSVTTPFCYGGTKHVIDDTLVWLHPNNTSFTKTGS